MRQERQGIGRRRRVVDMALLRKPRNRWIIRPSDRLVATINFAPRVKVPVLMPNGRFDFFFPEEGSQIPMFRLLGTPDAQKRRVVYDTGHNIARPDLIRESLDWLDTHLGPVRQP